jgi:hypothetical protein
MIIIEAAATGALAGVPMSVRSGWDTVRVQIDFLDHMSLYANERAPRLPITTRKKHMFARTAFYLNAWYVFVCAREERSPGNTQFCTFMRQIFICRSDSPMSAVHSFL